MKRFVVFIALCGLTGSAVTPSDGQFARQAAGQVEPYSARLAAQEEDWHFEGVAPEIRERRDRILAEIASGKAGPWAGRYMAIPGETTSTGVLWAPESGFLIYLAPDGPYLHHVSYGRAELSGGVLRLVPAEPIAKPEWPSNTFYDEFRCVRWGSHRYLIPPTRLPQFCDAVTSGDDREISLFLGTVGGRDWPPAGRPEVPAEYRTYLDAKPVVARVKSVVGTTPPHDYANQSRVVLSAGSAAGVRTGMKFWLHEPRVRATGPLEIRVVSVGAHTSEAVGEAIPVHEVTGESVYPKVGWRFRNRLPR